MTIDEFLAALVKRFPRNADEITAWTPDYRYALAGLTGEDMAESLRMTLSRWSKAWPPKPGEIMKRRVSASTSGKHPLNVQPMDLFGKPFGNGRDIPDLSDQEMRRWQYENGQLFMARLPFWNKMRQWMGDNEAAAVLKQGHDEDEIYRLFDQWRRGEPFDRARRPAVDHDAVRMAAREIAEVAEQLRMPGTGNAAQRPSQAVERSRATLRALADQHRASLAGTAPTGDAR